MNTLLSRAAELGPSHAGEIEALRIWLQAEPHGPGRFLGERALQAGRIAKKALRQRTDERIGVRCSHRVAQRVQERRVGVNHGMPPKDEDLFTLCEPERRRSQTPGRSRVCSSQTCFMLNRHIDFSAERPRLCGIRHALLVSRILARSIQGDTRILRRLRGRITSGRRASGGASSEKVLTLVLIGLSAPDHPCFPEPRIEEYGKGRYQHGLMAFSHLRPRRQGKQRSVASARRLAQGQSVRRRAAANSQRRLHGHAARLRGKGEVLEGLLMEDCKFASRVLSSHHEVPSSEALWLRSVEQEMKESR